MPKRHAHQPHPQRRQPPTPPVQQPIGLVEGASQAATLLHPVRMQLLERFRDPSSAAEVARDLELPRQRVGHHVRLLRQQGLLESVGERRKGNFVEQLLRTTARAYVIVPQALGDLAGDPAEIRDRFSSEYLTALAAQTLRDLAILRRRADESGKRLATLSLETEVRFESPAAQAAFAEELAATLEGLVGKYHRPASSGGRSFRFSVCGYPSLTGDEEARNDRESPHGAEPRSDPDHEDPDDEDTDDEDTDGDTDHGDTDHGDTDHGDTDHGDDDHEEPIH